MEPRDKGIPADDPHDPTASQSPGPASPEASGAAQDGGGAVGRRWRPTRAQAIVVAVTAVLCLAVGLRACLSREPWIEVAPGPTPQSNPLKGMMPFAPEPGSAPQLADTALPHTMEWVYIPLDRIVTGEGAYNWSYLESRLDAIAARGHQTVLRFYVDYPGRESAIPDYLVERGLVATRSYTVNGNTAGASLAPDYNDPDMMRMLTGFIRAFGAKYDGDPRLGFVTQGLVGFWGEGHTWPMNGDVSTANPKGEDWMASTDNQAALVAAWDEAFDVTPTLTRYPASAWAGRDVGYHDDSFGYATLDNADWHFMSLMDRAGATGAWERQPIGGEVYPGIQDCVMVDPARCANASQQIADGRNYDVPASIAATHATWLINDHAFTDELSAQEREATLRASTDTGYNLAVQRWRATGDEVEVELTNSGVAPFYYDWTVEAVVLDAQGRQTASTTLTGDLRQVLPGTTVVFSGELALGAGSSTLLLRAVNPMSGGAPLRFASAGQDADREGWLTLGAVTRES
ncbi:DUF4832 domain-containing protein [Actinomyces slackii]|uniref:DUF4832 domain-containing protein n=1 Tax=Actinomyces slackii TaxID=52774 RepID=A0A448KAG0_9ACTO|nr:DUF4832 domain-containing protein [Actinomyces slackii]VEG73907.1 Uncharacterised protein [Actinomyces slackii]